MSGEASSGLRAGAAAVACAGCGARLPPALLACPACARLVHAERLKELAASGDRSERAGDPAAALSAWRDALALLPPGTTQHARVKQKVVALSGVATSGSPPAATSAASSPAAPAGAAARAAPARSSGRWKWLVGLGSLGLLLAKLKWVLLFLLTKGKVLLLGLFQAKTFLSMAVALGVYASAWGWKLALGLVVSIYIHEMGHVFWLRRYGIPATAPMFIPGFGAFVRLKQNPATPAEDARVGLAGPVWGAVTAVVALAVGLAAHQPLLLAIARLGAWINLFNLLPVWQLDGGRGFNALSRRQRAIAAGVLWVPALAVGDGMLLLLAVVASVRAMGSARAPAQGDAPVLALYLLLAAGLALLISPLVPGGVPGAAGP
jgi:Zn-dependent protease